MPNAIAIFMYVSTDEYDILAVMQALVGVGCDRRHIGEALRVRPDDLDQCEKVHKKGTDRCNISIMGLWLSGNHMKNTTLYHPQRGEISLSILVELGVGCMSSTWWC